MKKVFSNDEIFHIFAKQSQSEGRNSQGNIFFRDNKIYSYGYHFCMGVILEGGTILINERGYSNTTAKHVHHLKWATNHMKQVFCPYPGDLNGNLEYWAEEIRDIQRSISKPRVRQTTIEKGNLGIASIVEKANKWAEAINTDLNSLFLSEDLRPYWNAAVNQDFSKLSEDLKALAIEKEKREKERQERARIELLEKKEAWLNGEDVNLWQYPEPLLRLNHTYERETDGYTKPIVETSKGAKVSLKAAKVLFDLIQSGKDIKGFDIDGYTVISLNGVLTIGCHKIERSEIDRFAKKMNWVS